MQMDEEPRQYWGNIQKYILLYVVVVDAASDVVADFDIFDRAAVKTFELVYSVYNSFSCKRISLYYSK